MQQAKSLLVEWLSALGELIFVSQCACCGEELLDGEHTMCLNCRYDMPLTGYYNRKTNHVVELFAGRVNFKEASALMFFKQKTGYQTMIHRMKYSGRDDIAYALGETYGALLSKSELYGGVECVVAVPLHWTKFFKRGYNQSAEFARGVANSMGVELVEGALRRKRRTRTQARLKDNQKRSKNVEGAFSLRNKEKIEGRGVLLLDDVITTGSTLESCADSINKALPDTPLYLGAIAVVSRNE
ncbi:MAG: phosphoribosyltransferase family protein [Rikenellaceae bacterium]